MRYGNRGRIAGRNISYLLKERESVVSVEFFFDTTFLYFTRNMQTPCRKSVDQLWIRELSVNCVGIVEESIGIEVVAITPCESMEGLTVSMTVSE